MCKTWTESLLKCTSYKIRNSILVDPKSLSVFYRNFFKWEENLVLREMNTEAKFFENKFHILYFSDVLYK